MARPERCSRDLRRQHAPRPGSCLPRGAGPQLRLPGTRPMAADREARSRRLWWSAPPRNRREAVHAICYLDSVGDAAKPSVSAAARMADDADGQVAPGTICARRRQNSSNGLRSVDGATATLVLAAGVKPKSARMRKARRAAVSAIATSGRALIVIPLSLSVV